ncbi:MAG TPA: hypothetical protein VG299_02065 [Candidatus Dormibacteraeota bacterium]|nr:hypothetical protein [Candidatus Dormibacteraeota bacterium]
MSTGAMATVGGASIQDDDWFGEGSAFDSGEDLAAALFALAGTKVAPATAPLPVEEISWPSFVAPDADPVFVEVERPTGLEGARRPGSMHDGASGGRSSSSSWSVRSPGEQLLPPTMSGRKGWTIRNSVAVLHRTEDAIAKLREEAVAMAFLAAAEACGRGRPASLERRSHPR